MLKPDKNRIRGAIKGKARDLLGAFVWSDHDLGQAFWKNECLSLCEGKALSDRAIKALEELL